MKRALLFALLSSFMLLWMTGCGSTVVNPNPPSSQAQVAFLQASNLPLAAQTKLGVVATPPSAKLIVMNVDGSEQQQVWEDTLTATHLSRNGSSLAATQYDTEGGLGMRLYTGKIGGDLIADITPADTVPQMPELSPDGTQVYFVNTGSIPFEIWSVNVGGSDPANLNTSHDYCMHEVTVAPNGQKLYFAGESNLDEKDGIFVMNSDGSDVAPVVWTDGSVAIHHPSVTADGTKLVFEVQSESSFDIYTANINGSEVTPLTKDGTDEDPMVVGDKILFVSDRGGTAQIYSMNLDGSGQTPLTNTSVANWFGNYYYGQPN